MILMMGIPSEPPLALVIDAAEREGIPFVVLNQRESRFADMVLSNSEPDREGTLTINEKEYRLDQFSGVYVRLMDHQHIPENQRNGLLSGDSEQIRKSYILHDMLQIWLENTCCRVMNRGGDMASNMSKPYQAQLIAAAGLRVPSTLVTNDPKSVQHFRSRYGRLIFKSISSVRSIVTELKAGNVAGLKRLRFLPTQFQEYVSGVDVRVHVVGDRLFATEVRSAAVDYRYATRDDEEVVMTPVTLPDDVADRCFRLADLLRLPLSGIDLKRTPDNEYFCFEVNPCPGYSYYQQHTGQDIAGAIVRYLEFGSAV